MLPAASRAQQSAQLAPQGPTIQAAAVGFRANDAKIDASTKTTAAAIVRRNQGQDVALIMLSTGGTPYRYYLVWITSLGSHNQVAVNEIALYK